MHAVWCKKDLGLHRLMAMYTCFQYSRIVVILAACCLIKMKIASYREGQKTLHDPCCNTHA